MLKVPYNVNNIYLVREILHILLYTTDYNPTCWSTMYREIIICCSIKNQVNIVLCCTIKCCLIVKGCTALKASGHYWLLLKIIISIKPYLVTSNGELLMEEVIFHEFDFETSELDFEASKSSIWKHTTLCDKGVFSYIILQLRRPVELKFSQVCYFMHICWDTASEKTGLWEIPIVSTAFNNIVVQPCFHLTFTQPVLTLKTEKKLHLMNKRFKNTVAMHLKYRH